MWKRRLRILVSCLAVAYAGAAMSQPATDFYRGREIYLMVGSDAGSGYDIYARLLARHLPKYIPGDPTVVVENVPTAGGMVAANDVADTEPQDGTYIAAPQSGVIVERLLHLLSPDGRTARFDARKLNWLGTMAQDVFVMIGPGNGRAGNLAQLKAATGYVVGAAGPNTDGSILVTLMNGMLGTKIKLVTGYAGAAGELLAMERGEIDGAPMAFSSAITLRPDLLSSKKYVVLLQMGDQPRADLKNTPFFANLVKTAADRAALSLVFSKYRMGRPFFVAPSVPQDRVQILRTAFADAVKDPDLLAEAKAMRLEISPLAGPTVQSLVDKLYSEPDDLVRRTRQLLGTQN
jgi:tripartite-type tricarboxylate transporter receptor subunit TctC